MERVDEKGKVFTERVRKHHVEVEVVTERGRVHGFLHIMQGQRVKDMLNNTNEQFLAVTDATFTEGMEVEEQKADFLAVNKRHVITVRPLYEQRLVEQEDNY